MIDEKLPDREEGICYAFADINCNTCIKIPGEEKKFLYFSTEKDLEKIISELWLSSPTVHSMRSLPATWIGDSRYICIDRSTIWGNPFRLKRMGRSASISMYEAYVRNNRNLLDKLPLLGGKNLVCHCKPLACHGDILVKLYNELHSKGHWSGEVIYITWILNN